MRQFILMLLLAATTNAFAQKEEAFFRKDSVDARKIAAMIMANAIGNYHYSTMLNKKNDIHIDYMNDERFVIKIHFAVIPEGILLVGVTGRYEELFPFWKTNFEPDADKAALEKTGKGKVLKIPFSGRTLIIYFMKQGASRWYIRGMFESESRSKQ